MLHIPFTYIYTRSCQKNFNFGLYQSSVTSTLNVAYIKPLFSQKLCTIQNIGTGHKILLS